MGLASDDSSPGSCYEKIVDGHAQCHGRCSVTGYKCANGPTGCGCVKDALSSPGSCYEKIVDGHAQCHGRCSVSGYHCANGPTGCGCIKQVLASNASSPGS